jgi:hypothetical protein
MHVKFLYYNNIKTEFEDVVYIHCDVTFGRFHLILKNNQDIWKSSDDIISVEIGE